MAWHAIWRRKDLLEIISGPIITWPCLSNKGVKTERKRGSRLLNQSNQQHSQVDQ